MRDKRVQIDDAFINHAWGEMKKQLDKEMPTDEKRRPGFGGYWWLAVLGLVVLTVGAGYAFWNKQQVRPIYKTQKPIAVEATPTMDIEHQANFDELETVLQNSPENAIAKSGTASRTDSPAKFEKLPKQRTANAALNNQGGILTESDLQASEDIGNQVVASLDEAISEPGLAQTTIEATAPLEQLGIGSLTNDVTVPSIAIEPVKQTGNRMAIETSYMRSIDNPASGMGLGFIVAKPTKNNRLGLQFGLGYNFIQQPLEVELAATQYDGRGQLAEEVFFYGTEFNTADASLIPSNAIVRTSRQSGLNLHYLSAPVRVTYAFTKRLSLRLGADAAVLLKAKSNFIEGGVLERLSSANKLAVEVMASEESVGSGNRQVSTFDLVSTIGVSYQISNRFSVSSQFRYGLIDVLPKNKTADFNRLLQVSLSYHLPNRK